jgi:hypothetical protein
MDQRKHSKQLWDHGVRIFHTLQRRGRSWMMKRRGGLKVGIHLIVDLVDMEQSKLGEILSCESEGEQEEEGEDSDGKNERSPPLIAGAKAGIRKTNSDDVLASPTKNTRKRKSTIPPVDSPAMTMRGKSGNK